MVDCTVSGCTEFYSDNGARYCVVCHTQSKDHGFELVQDDDAVVVGHDKFARVHIKKKSNNSEQNKEKSVPDLGRPWKTHEAFTLILKDQVDDLIKLGVDSKIKDMTFRMWALFLRKCDLAFLDKPVDVEKLSKLNLRKRPRDKYPLPLSKPKVGALRLNASRRKNPSLKKSRQRKEQEEIAELDEEFYAGDDPNEKPAGNFDALIEDDQQDQEEYSRLRSERIVSDDEGNPIIQKSSGELSGLLGKDGNIQLFHVLALLYVALQYVNPRVLPHDLVRWIKECRLQFNRKEFPEDMKLFNNDFQCLHVPKIPLPHTIVHNATVIAKMLGLEELPEVDIVPIVHRFIIELGLPGELHTMVANLIETNRPRIRFQGTKSDSMTLDFACLAMAYIVVTLKMIFGLDDETEWQMTEYARTLSSFIDFVQPLFIWSDWVSYMEMQMSRERAKWFPSDYENVRDIDDVDSVLELFDMQTRALSQCSNYRDYSAAKVKKRKAISSFMDDLHHKRRRKNPGLTCDDDDDDESDDCEDCTESSEEQFNTDRKRKSPHLPTENKKQIFQNGTIQYILEPEAFMAHLKWSDQTAREGNSSPFPGPNWTRCEDELSSSDFTRSPRQQKCNRSKKTGTTKKEILNALPFLPEEMPKAYDSYVIYPIPPPQYQKTEPCMETYPLKAADRYNSYRWLIDVCSSHLSEEPAVFEGYVQKLELVLFGHLKQLTKSEERFQDFFVERCQFNRVRR